MSESDFTHNLCSECEVIGINGLQLRGLSEELPSYEPENRKSYTYKFAWSQMRFNRICPCLFVYSFKGGGELLCCDGPCKRAFHLEWFVFARSSSMACVR